MAFPFAGYAGGRKQAYDGEMFYEVVSVRKFVDTDACPVVSQMETRAK